LLPLAGYVSFVAAARVLFAPLLAPNGSLEAAAKDDSDSPKSPQMIDAAASCG
jgi:hypothetical protein